MDYEAMYRKQTGQAEGWTLAETPQPAEQADSAAMLAGPKPVYH